MATTVVRLSNVTKEFKSGEVMVQALRGVSFEIQSGEFIGIVGPSGSGKSTVMGLIGGLDSPTAGTIEIDGVDISKMKERPLTVIRNEKIGFVFQSFNLIPTLTALENVSLPIQFSKKKLIVSDKSKNTQSPQARAKELLEIFGLGDRLHHRPTQLSGGQQQRVAIARALANQPALLLGDEPTGNLDSESSNIVMHALREVQQKFHTTVILVTHDMEIASQVDRLITIIDGRIAKDDPRASAQLQAVQIIREKRVTGELPAIGD